MTKLKQPATKAAPSPVVVRRRGVNHLTEMVRKEALRLAKGDPRRIEVVSRTEAIIRND